MEPLKPNDIELIRRNYFQAAPGEMDADLNEYERLLAERFAVDPAQSMSPDSASKAVEMERRLEELYRRLFRR